MKQFGIFLILLLSIFLVHSANAQINAPTLILPLDETQNYEIEPAYFEWSEVDTAEFYEIQVSPQADFDSLMVNQSVADISTTTSSLFYNWQFHWRARAGWDSSGIAVYGDWSNSNRFSSPYKNPVNFAPDDNSIGEEYNQVNFSWQLILDPIVAAGNNYYTFQLSLTNDFTDIVVDQEIQNIKTVQISDLKPDTTYYWRVKYNNDYGQSDWSVTTQFKTKAALLDQVILVKPSDRSDEVFPLNILFEWESVNNAEGYNFELAEDSLFNQIVESASLESTTYMTSVILYNSIIYWRVKAENSEGSGEWSDVWRFTTSKAAPQDAPVLVSPENNSENVPTDSIQFKWRHVIGADSFEIEISPYLDFNEIFFSAGLFDSSLYVHDFAENLDYYWRVKGINDLGDGPWSQTSQFKTQTGTRIIKGSEIISTFDLHQNYPNPFNPVTMITYQLPVKNFIELSIFNLLGQKVATLVSQVQPSGQHQVQWDASGSPSGIYYYQVRTAEYLSMKKMVLIK